jgi:hypothetical protein
MRAAPRPLKSSGKLVTLEHYDLARECALSFSMTFASRRARYAATDESARLFRFKVFELDPTSRAQAVPGLLDAA